MSHAERLRVMEPLQQLRKIWKTFIYGLTIYLLFPFRLVQITRLIIALHQKAQGQEQLNVDIVMSLDRLMRNASVKNRDLWIGTMKKYMPEKEKIKDVAQEKSPTL